MSNIKNVDREKIRNENVTKSNKYEEQKVTP